MPTPTAARRVRAKYRDAVAWIALNDDPTVLDPAIVVDLISVVLVADLWEKDAEQVAADVIRYRLKYAGRCDGEG